MIACIIKCPKCGKPMKKTERYEPFRSTFYNCPTCFPELESFRPKKGKEITYEDSY